MTGVWFLTLWCLSFVAGSGGWSAWGTCIPGPYRTLLQRNVSQETPTPGTHLPRPSLSGKEASAILELQVWYIYSVVTEWISEHRLWMLHQDAFPLFAPDLLKYQKRAYIFLWGPSFCNCHQGHSISPGLGGQWTTLNGPTGLHLF